MGATLTDPQKTDVRRWLGFSRIYAQLDPALENAMNAIREISDGGTQEDDSAVILVQGALTSLATIETKMTNLYDQYAINEAGIENVKMNALRATYGLKMEARRVIGKIEDALCINKQRDVLSPTSSNYDFGNDGKSLFDKGC